MGDEVSLRTREVFSKALPRRVGRVDASLQEVKSSSPFLGSGGVRCWGARPPAPCGAGDRRSHSRGPRPRRDAHCGTSGAAPRRLVRMFVLSANTADSGVDSGSSAVVRLLIIRVTPFSVGGWGPRGRRPGADESETAIESSRNSPEICRRSESRIVRCGRCDRRILGPMSESWSFHAASGRDCWHQGRPRQSGLTTNDLRHAAAQLGLGQALRADLDEFGRNSSGHDHTAASDIDRALAAQVGLGSSAPREGLRKRPSRQRRGYRSLMLTT